MTCEIVKDLIPMCVDNTASADAAAEVNRHIGSCPRCRQFYNSCRLSEKKWSMIDKERFSSAFKNQDVDVDAEFADFSKKLKAKKRRQLIISMAVLLALAAHVTVDIIKLVKRKRKS